MRLIRALLCLCSAAAPGLGAEPFRCETTKSTGPIVAPWQAFEPDPDYHGQWLVTGDLDGDGKAEIVTARHHGQHVTALQALRLDGAVLWKSGEPGGGAQGLGCDVPVQIYDLDGDGKGEVYLSKGGNLLVLSGATGSELRKLPLPRGLHVADCIAFANLRGLERPQDIIVKDRYRRIWAYTREWEPLWAWQPSQYRTCHHPTLVDIDSDGKDEVIAGYTLLDDDGKELWTVSPKKASLRRGHLDCSEVMVSGQPREAFRIVLTYCGANCIALVDGTGKTLWEVSGHHFESVDAGKIRADVPGKQVVVDIDKLPFGKGLVWLLDDQGRLLGEYVCGYGRHHRLIDWNGDGLAEILIGNTCKLFDGKGNCVAHFGPVGAFGKESGPQGGNDPGPFAAVGDLDGDRRPEVILHTTKRVHIYKSAKAGRIDTSRVGTGRNFTLY